MDSKRRFSFVLPWLIAGLIGGAGAGCGKVPTPGVYKLDIQQGNVVTRDMLARLEPNMEKRKVRFLLGTPLVSDTFNENRWDYLYSFQEGGHERTQQHIVLIFEGDRLVQIEGDADNSVIEETPEPTPETVVSVPDQEPKGIFGGVGGWFGTDDTRVPRQKPPPESEEEDGSFAGLPKAEGATARKEDVPDDGPATSNPAVEDSSQTESQAASTGDEQVDGEGDDGFFVRLKEKFEGERTEESETESDESTEEDDQGFFERLSNQFGLDAPLEPQSGGKN